MKTIIVDPFPRKMNLIFSKDKLVYLKRNFNLINAPNRNKKKFYEDNISCLLYTSPSPRDVP